MLRRLDVNTQWRSLAPAFWPSDVPLGRATVVYGHNGSGKSTLAEALLSVAAGDAATALVWEQDDKRKVQVGVGEGGPSPAMAVFTRKWVEANLAEFLAGDNADAIVTLGEAAIDAKERERELEGEIKRLREDAKRANEADRKAEQKVEAAARAVQERIVQELQPIEYGHYTKSRYTVNKVRELLRQPRPQFPSIADHAEALARLSEPAPSTLQPVAKAPQGMREELIGLAPLLSRTPTRVAIKALESNPQVQAWVEQGITLHDGESHCLFCSGDLTTTRREELARHFDESWLQIRGEAQGLLARVRAKKTEMDEWLLGLPVASALTSELVGVYQAAREEATREVGQQQRSLDLLVTAISEKVSDPSATPAVPVSDALDAAVTSTVLVEAVAQHNDQARRYEEITTERKVTVFDHILGSESHNFRTLEEQATTANAASTQSTKSAILAEQSLERLRQQQFTTAEMAATLTSDLARVYGKDHLSIVVTDDGKSYACRRGNEAGTNLSEGERTSLSLLYFLRNLEDQQVRGLDPGQRIVVIDDPSSSLDREALFATHQWLVDTLRRFGQYIVLTHDFQLLRLFITSHRSKWSASAKAIGEGSENEIRFPRVAFLELYAAAVDGNRTSKVGELPSLLRNSTTEYGYLFSMVMKGIEQPEDHERLFLLPNAARRVLEVFASYKAPHRPNFLQQLEWLVQTQPNEPYRAVYDFCNRFSHGEGHETVEVLDARAVHAEICRCMQFLRSVDADHFQRMCEAVKVDPKALS
jgi:wobble nucleotide-excising tRNase